MNTNVFYKINHITDKQGSPKEHIEDIERLYIPYVVKVGRSAMFIHAENEDKCLKTSTVEEVAIIQNMLVVVTMNTVYWFKPVVEGE